jgi:hypothetical protein
MTELHAIWTLRLCVGYFHINIKAFFKIFKFAPFAGLGSQKGAGSA